MAWHCSVCARPDVRLVNDALVRGEPRRAVARRYGIHHSTLDRHWWTCVPDDIREAAGAAETDGIDVLDGRALLEAMQTQMMAAAQLFTRLEKEMDDEEKAVDRRAIVAALREVRASIESTAKLAFTVQDRPTKPDEAELPELDAAIIAALAARDIGVEAPKQPANVVDRGLALPAAPLP